MQVWSFGGDLFRNDIFLSVFSFFLFVLRCFGGGDKNRVPLPTVGIGLRLGDEMSLGMLASWTVLFGFMGHIDSGGLVGTVSETRHVNYTLAL